MRSFWVKESAIVQQPGSTWGSFYNMDYWLEDHPYFLSISQQGDGSYVLIAIDRDRKAYLLGTYTQEDLNEIGRSIPDDEDLPWPLPLRCLVRYFTDVFTDARITDGIRSGEFPCLGTVDRYGRIVHPVEDESSSSWRSPRSPWIFE